MSDRPDGIDAIRSTVIIGLFILSGAILWMIYSNPALLKEGAFMLIVGMIIGQGGQGAATAWLFGGTQTGAQVMKSNAETLAASAPPPPPGSTITTTTATVTPETPAP